MLKLITEDKKLRRATQPVGLSEGKKIAEELFEFLRKSGEGIGLAANQVGINKKVCVVNVDRPLYFVNPQVIDASGRIIFEEVYGNLELYKPKNPSWAEEGKGYTPRFTVKETEDGSKEITVVAITDVRKNKHFWGKGQQVARRYKARKSGR